MTNPITRAGIVLSVVSCALIGGCGRSESKGSSAGASASSADPLAGLTVHTYTARGEVISLPDAVQDLQIRHEAIPEFQNPDGSMGMNTMVMPFWPPQGISKDDPRIAKRIAGFSLDGIAAGQKVEITFDVLWDEKHQIVGYYATKIARLGDGVTLDFSPLESATAHDHHE